MLEVEKFKTRMKVIWLRQAYNIGMFVEARMPGSPVAGWTDTVVPSFRHSAHCRYWPPSASICVRENMCCSTHTHNSFRDRSFSASVASDISSMHWKDIYLGCGRPRRIATNLLSCALEAYLITYLLTYLLTYKGQDHSVT